MNFEKKMLLRNRSFKTLLITDAFSKFADSMDNVIVTLLVINLTGSSTSTGILLAITTLPGILFSLIGGTLSDVQNNKKIITIVTMIQSALILLIAVFVRINGLNFAILCIVLFVLESFSRMYSPAFTKATVDTVSKENYQQAISTITTIGSLVQMFGNALCSTLVSFIGYTYTLLVNAISYFCASILSTKLNIKSQNSIENVKNGVESVINSSKIKEFLSEIWSGIRYVTDNRRVFGVILTISSINFILAWFDVALPFLLIESLNIPVESLGYIKTVSTVMFVIAGVFVTKKEINNYRKAVSISIAFLGTAVFAMSLIKNVFVSSALWGSAAFFRTIASLILMTQLTTSADDSMIGRVMGVFMFVTSILMLVSRLLSGYLVSYLGAPNTFKIAGCLFLGLTFCYLKVVPNKQTLVGGSNG